ALAWWTDHAARRHVRVKARRDRFNRLSREHLFDGRRSPRPPLSIVYPRPVFWQEGRQRLLAVCPCGVWGEPEAISWMRTCCGPCNDRREAGGEARAAGQGYPCHHAQAVLELVFSPDGNGLASTAQDGTV